MKRQKSQKKQHNRVCFNRLLLFLFILLLPTQFGRHFFFDFSYVAGVRVDYLAPTLYITDLLALLLFVLNLKSVWLFLKNRKIVFSVLLLFLPVAFSLSLPLAIYRLFKILEFVLIIVVFQKKIISSRNFFIAFLIGSLVEFVLATWQLAIRHSVGEIFYFLGERYLGLSSPNVAKAAIGGVEILRPYGTFSHPNSLSGFYLLLYFFTLTSKRISSPILKNTILFTSALLVFLSFSKIAIAAFLVGNLIYFLTQQSKKVCLLCLASRIITFSVVALIFMQAKTDPLSFAKRIELIKNSLTMIASHPFFGVGLGNYVVAQNSYPSHYSTFINQPVHNIFLLFVAEAGIIVTGFLTFLFLPAFRKLVARHPYLVLVLLVTGFFDHYWLTLQQNLLLLGLVLGSL